MSNRHTQYTTQKTKFNRHIDRVSSEPVRLIVLAVLTQSFHPILPTLGKHRSSKTAEQRTLSASKPCILQQYNEKERSPKNGVRGRTGMETAAGTGVQRKLRLDGRQQF